MKEERGRGIFEKVRASKGFVTLFGNNKISATQSPHCEQEAEQEDINSLSIQSGVRLSVVVSWWCCGGVVML